MPTPFGKYLRTKRVEAGFSLRALADELDVSHVYLGEVERGVRGPLASERWHQVVSVLEGVTLGDLEKHAATSRPVQLELSDAPPRYQDLGLALARRIEERDLGDKDLDEIFRILSGHKRRRKKT